VRAIADIATAILDACAAASITSVRLCDEAGIAWSTYHDILTGRTWPDVVSLVKLEAALKVPLWPSQIPG